VRFDHRVARWITTTWSLGHWSLGRRPVVAAGIACGGAAALVLLDGCALVDQRTFAGTPEPPAPAQVAATPDAARTPLISIGFDRPDPHYQELLRYAVAQAMLRRPDVAFDVVAVLPKSDTQTQADDRLTQGQTDALAVASALRGQGIPADRVILGVRIDPAAKGREVRVYVH